MKTVLHKASERGHADYGWLKANYSFSFANYYNPNKIHFGVLRVLNDDTIAPGMGFDTHPHDNMEIITIPLEGELRHSDSMGFSEVIKKGDVQVMSAGTGIYHSEFNNSSSDLCKLLQIWVFPKKRNVEPRYDQITINETQKKNNFLQIESPNKEDKGTWIHQNAWFSIANFDNNFSKDYQLHLPNNGVYAFVIKGKFLIENTELSSRDALGARETDRITVKALENDSEILLIEVPMYL